MKQALWAAFSNRSRVKSCRKSCRPFIVLSIAQLMSMEDGYPTVLQNQEKFDIHLNNGGSVHWQYLKHDVPLNIMRNSGLLQHDKIWIEHLVNIYSIRVCCTTWVILRLLFDGTVKEIMLEKVIKFTMRLLLHQKVRWESFTTPPENPTPRHNTHFG